jgi:hypothetical protein
MRGGGGEWSRREGVERKEGEWRGGMEKMFRGVKVGKGKKGKSVKGWGTSRKRGK